MRLLQKLRQWKAHRDWKLTGVWILDLGVSKEKMRRRLEIERKTGNRVTITTGAECSLSGYPTLLLHEGLRDEYLYEALEHEIIHHLVYKLHGYKTTQQLDNIAGTVQDQREIFGIHA